MYSADLKAVAEALETAAGASTTANDSEGGWWLRIALASEALAGASTTANDNVFGFMLRTAKALESIAGTSGAEENDGYGGLLKRIADALEVQAGAVTAGSLEERVRIAALAAVFVAFDPSYLFASGDAGGWWNPNDTTTLDTNPVTNMTDKSGNGNTQNAINYPAFPSTRPSQTVSGGKTYLGWTNNEYLSATIADPGYNMATFLIADVGSDNTFALQGQGKLTGLAQPSPSGGPVSSGLGVTAHYVNGIRGNTSSATAMNDGQVSDALTSQGPKIFETRNMNLNGSWTFMHGPASAYGHFIGKTGMEILCLNPTQENRYKTINYMAEEYGLTIDNTQLFPAGLDYDHDTGDDGKLNKTTEFARLKFTTTATSVTVTARTNVYSTDPALAYVAIYVDGVRQQFTLTADGEASTTLTLSAGSKTIEIVNGPQTSLSGPFGTWVTKVAGNADLVPVSIDRSNTIVVYGDSISSGATVSQADVYAYPMLQRAAGKKVAVEAYGSRTLKADTSNGSALDSAVVAAFVRKLKHYRPSKIIMLIGTNDFGLNSWNATDFGAAYAALLDALHTALPSLQVVAVTPLYRANQTTPNTFGNTLADYRSQISSVGAARSSYVTVVDGSSLVSVGNFSDGLHPNQAGQAQLSTALASYF